MSDLELSKALALAIGWKIAITGRDPSGKLFPLVRDGRGWRVFDYRDPAVIWRIAERFGIFPHPLVSGNLMAKAPEIVEWECAGWHYTKKQWLHHTAPTAAMACALVVIAVSEPKP